jgi:uncharacterized protein with NRDE domain
MCTLAAFVGVWPEAPLIVIANRDERLARASSGPRRWPGEDFVAPRDDEAGGTWLGLHRSGLFVGLTNRAGAAPNPRLASRGQLVVEALRRASALAVHEAFANRSLDGRSYNPFHVFYADPDGAFVTVYDGAVIREQKVSAGLAIVTERSLGGDDRGRTERVRRSLAAFASRSAPPALEELAPVMSEHDPVDAFAGVCVHAPALGYGTRSSLLLDVRRQSEETRLATPGGARWAGRWKWAEGPPCSTPYADVPLEES